MKKKIIGIFVCMLLIATVLPVSGNVGVESTSMLLSSGSTLYVGGNGTGNYTRIQDAIDNSSNGDTVFVYDDSSPYYENVVVDKSINLVGEDRDTTIIDGGEIDDVINVTADRVNISGFTIQNCGNRTLYIYSDAGTDIRADYCTISGNIFISNYANGIVLLWANNNVISDNILVDNEHTGIHLSHYSNNNTIRNNTVEQSHNAIELIIKCKNNTIINNTASYCELAGINFYWDCNNNIVSENTIINNYEHGIWLYDSHNNSFFHNTLVNNWVRNARDKDGNNSWDNGYPSGGNFWDDYNGTDDDGDGIGDTPYNISGGSNQDRYPLMEPYTYKNTLYVGGSGPGNYSKIQDAIDDSSNGDTVYVYDDSSPYYENLIVDKSITLKGENKETTVINGSDSGIVVNISSDNVILSGFTVLNHGNSSHHTSILFIQSNYNIISGNIIKVDNDYGINIIYSEYTTISGNTITSNTSKGSPAIYIYEGKNNNISKNIIKNFMGGIVFGYSNNYSIYGNTLIDNTFAINPAGFSINDVISLNNISGSLFGIYALNCFNYKIIKNNFIGNRINAGFGYYLFELFVFGFKYKSIRDVRSTIKWDGNYWNRPRIFPKPIRGELPPAGRIPWFQFDLHPAQEPYDIEA